MVALDFAGEGRNLHSNGSKQMNVRDQIRQPVVWVPALATVVATVVGIMGNEMIKGWNTDPTFEAEQEKVMAVFDLDASDRPAKLCEFLHSNLFQSKRVVEAIAERVADDPKCTKDGYLLHIPVVDAADLNDQDQQRVTDCLRASAAVTASCQAYDKSGFHSSPSDSCEMTITADEGRFFAQDRVTVVSESYRRQRGPAAGDAMKPAVSDDGLIRAFSGSIGCTHSKGTGRTCSASATIRAISYPTSCSDLKDILKDAN